MIHGDKGRCQPSISPNLDEVVRAVHIWTVLQQPTNDPARLDLEDPHASEVAKRAFFKIADLWGLSSDDARVLLGQPGRSSFFSWKKGQGGSLSRDEFERVSYVLGIYKGLQVLFPDSPQADEWIKKANEAFGGRSALDRMLGGNVSDLHAVRVYIEQVRGGRS